MYKSFYMVRHGRTDWNDEFRLQGLSDIPLNNTGISQAESLVEPVALIKPQLIISSPLQRALATAEIANAQTGVPIVKDPALVEVSMGDYEGMLIKDLTGKFDIDRYSRSFSSPQDFEMGMPGGESKNQAMMRISRAMHRFALECEYERIGVFAHGLIIRLFLVSTGIVLEDMGNCDIVKVECVVKNNCPEWKFVEHIRNSVK